MLEAMKKLLVGKEGMSSVEYAILLALIATALITAVVVLQNEIVGLFGDTASDLSNARSQ